MTAYKKLHIYLGDRLTYWYLIPLSISLFCGRRRQDFVLVE